MHRFRSILRTLGPPIGLVIIVALVWRSGPPGDRVGPTTMKSTESLRQEALRRAFIPLEWAHQRSRQLGEDARSRIAGYFSAAKSRLPEFADDVLSWSSKWRLVTDHLPVLGTRDAHQQFVAQRFAMRVFAPTSVTAFVEQTLNTMVADLRGIEEEMLTLLRQEFAGLSFDEADDTLIPAKKLGQFARRLEQEAMSLTTAALETDAITLVASCLVTDAIVMAIPRMSLLFLRTGAAMSPIGIGVTLLLGLAVDQAVVHTWDAIADPRGECLRRLEAHIDELHLQLIEGTDRYDGLRQRIDRLLLQRERLRLDALQLFLQAEATP